MMNNGVGLGSVSYRNSLAMIYCSSIILVAKHSFEIVKKSVGCVEQGFLLVRGNFRYQSVITRSYKCREASVDKIHIQTIRLRSH